MIVHYPRPQGGRHVVLPRIELAQELGDDGGPLRRKVVLLAGVVGEVEQQQPSVPPVLDKLPVCPPHGAIEVAAPEE